MFGSTKLTVCFYFAGWFCAERAHPCCPGWSRESLCRDAHLRHQACGVALQEGHPHWWARTRSWRRVRLQPVARSARWWEFTTLNAHVDSSAGPSPAFYPPTSLMFASWTRSYWTSLTWSSSMVTMSPRYSSCLSPTRRGPGQSILLDLKASFATKRLFFSVVECFGLFWQACGCASGHV